MITASSPPRHPSGQFNNVSLSWQYKNKANALFLGYIREIRAEAQNLQRYLVELKAKLIDPHQKIAAVAQSWQTVQMLAYQRHDARVKDLFAALRKLMEENPALLNYDGDAIVTMENIWERVDPQWPKFSENENLDENVVLAQIADVDTILCEVIRAAEKLTLPDRVNDRLRELRVGQTINFHAEFSDELPELAPRILALTYLHDHPLIVLGVVDVENGLIYRASSSIWQRRLSPVYIALPAILGGILVYLSYTFLPFLKGDVPHHSADVLPYVTSYLSVIAGGFAHTAVDTVKQYRSNKGQAFTALGDLLMWIHVKEGPIIAGTLLLWLGFVGLVISQQGTDWGAAFFVGYSIDSFVDLFLQRFTTVVTTRTDALKAQLAQAPK
ncbi:MAG TPA: hypothetical protein VKR06_01555 [Ktedonosporobacter sp.]|nr:hypothetical protein [Ktedonosporobacter sp.]